MWWEPGGRTTPTDSRSKRLRASRRGGQLLTRARGASNKTGLPSLRSLPDAPRPGRSHRTHRARSAQQLQRLGRRTRWHLGPFIPVTNLLERSLGEVRRRTKVIGRFPGESSCLSLCWAVLDLIITQSTRVVFTDLERQALTRIGDTHSLPSPEEVVAA